MHNSREVTGGRQRLSIVDRRTRNDSEQENRFNRGFLIHAWLMRKAPARTALDNRAPSEPATTNVALPAAE